MWDLGHKEGWVLKNWCFWTMVLENTLESTLDCKEIQPLDLLKEISPGCSLEGLMWKLKLQYFGHLMWRADSLENTLMREGLGAGEGDDRGWDGWMASPTRWTWVWVNSGSWWCYLTVLFSVFPFSSYLQSFTAPGSFLMSQQFTSGGQSIGASASASVLPMNIKDWFPLYWLFGSPSSPRYSQEYSPTP